MARTAALLLPAVLASLVAATGIRPPTSPCTSAFKPYVSKGCYADDASTTLVMRSGLDQNAMTIDLCTAECKGNGFRYAGLKYYGVCYCGDSLSATLLDDSQCTEACSGDKTAICGSDNNLSVYEDPTFPKNPSEVSDTDYVSLGCHSDSSAIGRALSYPLNLDSSTFTGSLCIDACRKQGFPYAGIEYGQECWCGQNLGTDSAKIDASTCNIACSGDSSQTCGGDKALDLYYAKDLESTEPCGFVQPSSSTTSSVTSTTSATSTSTTTVPVTTATTATTTAMCTATQTITPTCEFECGKWCAPALPTWSNAADCATAAKTCALQVASCFKSAGWPAAIDCFEFASWCSSISSYCSSSCRGGSCSKSDCWKKNKPDGGNAPTTTTTVFPCTASTTLTTTTAAPTTTVCPPNPSNICTQPTNDRYGYSSDHPVGGIALPVVSCNDNPSDFSRNPFKLYSNPDSRNCPSFNWNQRPDACQDACEQQYDQCQDTYTNSCGNLSWKNGHSRRGEEGNELETRHYYGGSSSSSSCAVSDNQREWCRSGSDDVSCWGKGANSPSLASSRCKAQYRDCLAVNRRVNPGKSCSRFCSS